MGNEQHPIENLMRSTMENLKDMIDVNTVIGDSIQTSDGTCIVPISKVSFGFASGGSEFGTAAKYEVTKDSKHPFGGGSGAGVSVKPVAFLIVRKDTVRLLNVDHEHPYEKVLDSIPQILDNIKGMLNLDKKNQNKNTQETPSNLNDIDESDSSSNNLF
ncbi:GerW family sporulation protein [Clostridium isatidis]|uniref:Sporulation protein YtfJ n=1 Tax=Clostridium isatidis TaxID=182773 RepID=A0A343JAZ7_9CLOT|nr:GerW family sporulation protein [Clostridium isatidis]ASW42705.1 sporulation protein YtfJ [Clostridium isatidis]NLZ34418.1 sporulation protein YtfJ [Clostridiales bacterium]